MLWKVIRLSEDF